MQVVNELIGQLRSKGLLSDALLNELQELGFDKDGQPEFDDYQDSWLAFRTSRRAFSGIYVTGL